MALMLVLLAVDAHAVIAIDSVSTVVDNNPTTLTVSHTTGAGSDRLMMVGVSMLNQDLETVSTVTYNGVGLVFVGQISQSNDSRVELWSYLNPPAVSANVIVTFNEQVQLGAGIGVVTFTGVDQLSPYGAFQSNSGDSNTASATVTSAAGDTVLGVMAAERQDNNPVVAGGSAQWTYKTQTGNNRTAGAGATFTGAGSVNLTWNLNEPDDWAIGAIPLRDASASGSTCDTFRDEFSSISYSRQDGTLNWAANWNEVGDNGSPANGDIQIGSNSLQLEGDGTTVTALGGPYIEREADLSGYGSATLSFDYRETGNWEASDDFEIYVSGDGGANWNLIQTFSNDQGATFQSLSIDITAYISYNTRIAFVEKANNGSEIFYLDNVQIEACASGPSPLAYFEMNEASWNGTANEVLDSSGNGNAGTAVGNATTVDPGRICLGGDIPFNNTDATQDALDTELDLDTDIGTTGTISMWYKPNTAWASGGDRMLIDASTTADNKYFFLTLLNTGVLRFRIEDSTDADFQLDTTAKAFPADEWHYLAITWDLPGDRLEIYIDGVLDASLTPNTSGSWGALGSVYLGDNRSTYHPSGTANSANGVIDEARIYDLVQTATEIQTDMNAPGSCANPLAWFQLDAPPGTWNGTVGEVVDQTGTVLNASALGTGAGVNAVTTPICRGIDVPFNNTDAAQYGFDSRIDPDDDIGNSGTISFWYRSDNDWAGGGDRALFDASPDSLAPPNKFFLLMLRNDGALQFAVEDSTDSDFLFNTAAQGFLAGDWVHIAVTWDMAGNRQIYVNSTLAATDTRGTSGALGELDTLYFGDNRSTYHFGGTANSANGVIDEVRVYNSVQPQTEIQSDMNATHSCLGISLDHFRITPAAIVASTCLPNAVTIIAEDASNNPLTNYTDQVNITVSTNHGNWSVNDADNVTSPNPDNDDDGAVSYTYVLSDIGEIILDLTNTHAETLTIEISDPLAAVTSTSVAVTFVDNVLVITEDPVQVAGRAQSMNVAMWTNDGSNCFINLDYNSAAQSIEASIDRGGVLLAANAPSIDAVTIPDALATATITLDFSVTPGQVNFNLDSSDVGQYRLTLVDITNNFSDQIIAGTGNLLTVRPFGISVNGIMNGATANPGGTAPSDPVFTAAGTDFEATVAGVLWDAADDSNNDGVLDSGVFAGNAVAPSYAWDTTLSVSAAGFTPATGVPGVLNNGATLLAEFSGGSFNITDLQYTEVGSFTLQSRALDFLGVPGLDIVGDDIIIGRFTPASLLISMTTDGAFVNTNISGLVPYTYIGQRYSYDSAARPSFVVSALNAAGAPTLNYTGAWAKMTAASVSLSGPTADNIEPGSDAVTLMAVTYTQDAASFIVNDLGGGRIEFVFTDDAFVYDKDANSEVPPFNPEVDLIITDVTDTDAITNTGTATLTPDGSNVALRFGRLRMENAFGSELSDLIMNYHIEYYDEIGATPFWTRHDDADTTIVAPGDISAVPGNTAATAINLSLLPGKYEITLSAPLIEVVETVTNLVDSSAEPWLQYDWDEDGLFDNNPSALATFGIYGGDPVQIYIQQIYQ
jgi:MSHA biogenesis protein MshQ